MRNHSDLFIMKKHLPQHRGRGRGNPGMVGAIRQLSVESCVFGSRVQWHYFFWELISASAFSCSFCCSSYWYLQIPGQKSLILGPLCLSPCHPHPTCYCLMITFNSFTALCGVAVLYLFHMSLVMDTWTVSSPFLLYIILKQIDSHAPWAVFPRKE